MLIAACRCDAARGMEYLHGHRPPIVHRDLKSLNLLVDRDWNCKIADFGLSKVTSGQTLNSRMGSLNWVAPEILLQNSPYTGTLLERFACCEPHSFVTEYADIYSFGLILWETLTHTVRCAFPHTPRILSYLLGFPAALRRPVATADREGKGRGRRSTCASRRQQGVRQAHQGLLRKQAAFAPPVRAGTRSPRVACDGGGRSTALQALDLHRCFTHHKG